MGLQKLEDFGFGQVEAQGFQGDFEFVVVDSLVFVEVEEGELGGLDQPPSRTYVYPDESMYSELGQV